MAKLQSMTISDTGALTLPAGTDDQRSSQGSTLASFTAVGTTTWTCPAGVTSVEVLVVAGGGGGGGGFDTWAGGGGGGGGGVIYLPAFSVTPGTVYTVTVGGGGAGQTGSTSPRYGYSGGNSVFGSLTAIGGGGGNSWNSSTGSTAPQGGSGGGGQNSSGPFGGALGTNGQGFKGGDGMAYTGNNSSSAGGGGGAGGPGSAAGRRNTTGANDGQYGGDGGPGVFYAITGQERAYGGGGGGGGGVYGGAGGSGIGGNGGAGTGQNGTNGVNGTGAGGGGAGSTVNPNGTTNGGNGGSGCVHIRYNTTETVPLTTGSMRLNTSRGVEFASGSTYWRQQTLPFLTRQIITTHYVGGGYKDGVPWRNVNRTIASTDTTTNLGDQLETPSNYKNGAVGKNVMYFFGATATNAGASNYIIGFNMRTEVGYTPASRYLNFSTAYNAVVFKEMYTAFVHQGPYGGAIDEFNLQTETLTGSIGTTIMTDYTWGMSHESHGLIYASDNNTRTFHYATKTPVVRSGTHPSAHHQQKAVNTKITNCYAGNEGSYNGGNAFRRTNMVTDTTSGTVAKPVTNSGEENFTMGQEHQYMLGMYNGLQNNISWKFYYASETGYQVGSTTEPKGQGGMSSAITGWRD